MALLAKIKSILGLSESGEEDRDVTVTVEHDPQNEAAVEGAETGVGGGAAGDAGTDDAGGSSRESSLESAAIDKPDSSPIDEAEPDAAGSAEEASTDDEAAATGADESSAGGAEPDAADEPVDSLSGIGPAYADRLGEAGIETVGDLANADAAEVAEGTDLSEGRVQGWIDQAREA